jgi:hypothetical protein
MLSFATEFPIKETDAQGFVTAIRAWLEGSPHTSLSRHQLATIPDEGRWKINGEGEQLEALIARSDASQTAGFRHKSDDGKIEWTTTVVYFSDESESWVGVRTSREATHTKLSLPPAKKPQLVRTILSSLGGGLDGELYVSDRPTYLKDNDVGMATRLLNADADAYLPLVYVSRGFDEKLNIDPDPLARNLGGMAHVVVEPNRDFSKKIQRDVSSRNAYGGTVGVYWPNGDHSKYFFDEMSNDFDFRKLIVDRIRAALCNRRPLTRCTWSHAEAAVARNVIDQLRNTGSNDVEEYISAFDAELKVKQEQINESEQEIFRLKSKLMSQRAPQGDLASIFHLDDQQEFFAGEFNSYLKDSLTIGAQAAPADSRRREIVESFIGSIPDGSSARDRREKLKKLLRDYSSMTKAVRDGLNELGFIINEDGKHYKLVYMKEPRYTFVLPKTGSDYRGGLNSASDIGKRIF